VGEPGVRNFRAQHQKMKGDTPSSSHGQREAVIGIVEVIWEAYPDPTDAKGVFVAVTVKSVKPLPKPVTLAAVKVDGRFKDMALVKYSRLSVQPVTDKEWELVCAMGGLKE
jgi:predicted RNA-binding protein with PUA-like domain